MPSDNWGTPLRDVLTDADFRIELGEINSKLVGFAKSDGSVYQRPYELLSSNIDGSLSENRIETWKKLFQELGLVWVEDGILRLTDFGRLFDQKHNEIEQKVDQSTRALAKAAASVLGRHQLLNPTTQNRGYPPNCNVLPHRAIWTAMKELDSLHWEELHRVLLKVMVQDDLDEAIEKIKKANKSSDYSPQDPISANKYLGEAIYTDAEQAARRITPWFSAAGFGGLLIDREPKNGRRFLTSIGESVVSDELQKEVSWRDFGSDQKKWISYLTSELSINNAFSRDKNISLTSEIADDDGVLIEVKKLLFDDLVSGVLFVGTPGTGKSWYARQIAIKLANGKKENIREVQFHPSYQYEDFVEGYVPDKNEGFRLVDRHLLEMAKRASQTDEIVVLVIDEFSRTDPARVLGETLTYMEHSMRGVDFFLPSGRQASIPKNLVFLATMNPEDRSVDEIDDAMERRWAKIKLQPSVDVFRKFLTENTMNGKLIGPSIELFKGIQAHIELGHAFFKNAKDLESLERIWRSQVEFLARKHFRFEQEKLNQINSLWNDFVEKTKSGGEEVEDNTES